MPPSMSCAAYADMLGTDRRDRRRLADTGLLVEVEEDRSS